MLKSRTRISVTFLRSSPTLPDAIVLDVEMPRMSGPEMIGQLRICKGGEEKIPVLLISPCTARTSSSWSTSSSCATV
jgi:response regulator RpfG family c-di-GMP phosphodiesterase